MKKITIALFIITISGSVIANPKNSSSASSLLGQSREEVGGDNGHCCKTCPSTVPASCNFAGRDVVKDGSSSRRGGKNAKSVNSAQ